ncbi:hypothetical protein [Aestuariispira ectoiniformans]|uniref:hypothetical protein n=1 Tax=Aestuariispira ectoiniformans TaxID=2775080 RepID=UPI00223C27B0|nr:hypothetical protein [Aestuariispira ectoiniformans]
MTVDPYFWEQILFIALGVLVFSALACQVVAMFHKRKDWIHFIHKDSMFRHKELVFDETGMRFIRAQKWIAVAAVVIGALLMYVNTLK